MATKGERAFIAVNKKAEEYVDKNSSYLSKQYCLSWDQISQVERAYRDGFMAGVSFK